MMVVVVVMMMMMMVVVVVVVVIAVIVVIVVVIVFCSWTPSVVSKWMFPFILRHKQRYFWSTVVLAIQKYTFSDNGTCPG